MIMKRLKLLPLAALLAVACSQPKTHFVLHGYVPGAMDSTQVELRSEGDNRDVRLSGYVVNGEFELTGEAPVAAYCRLSMNNYDAAQRLGQVDDDVVKYVEAGIFVENGNLVFRTPHIDSLPQSFWRYDIRKEKNYTMKGSASHDVYAAYALKTLELRAEIRKLAWAVREKATPEMLKTLAAKKNELRTIIREYIASQKNLPVNLYLAQALEMEPFTYDQAYLDGVMALFASYQDTLPALLKFREAYGKAAAYTQGTPFAGGEVYTPKGDTLNLTKYMKPGRYMLVDFWASWCGPCRASFPHLRKVYQAYGKKLEFLSVSVDKKDADWRKAMKEEQLPWTQLCATKAFTREMGKVYQITSIPTFLIVDPEGKIVFSGHDSGELDLKIEELGL